MWQRIQDKTDGLDLHLVSTSDDLIQMKTFGKTEHFE